MDACHRTRKYWDPCLSHCCVSLYFAHFIKLSVEKNIYFLHDFYRVLTRQGKFREKWNFTKVREMSGNFDVCQGNLKNEAKVREMSGNFETLSGKFALGL